MERLKCENCGSQELINENGIVTCQSCGAKFPNLNVEKLGWEEQLRGCSIIELIVKTITS